MLKDLRLVSESKVEFEREYIYDKMSNKTCHKMNEMNSRNAETEQREMM